MRLRHICRTLSFSGVGRNKRQASALSGFEARPKNEVAVENFACVFSNL